MLVGAAIVGIAVGLVVGLAPHVRLGEAAGPSAAPVAAAPSAAGIAPVGPSPAGVPAGALPSPSGPPLAPPDPATSKKLAAAVAAARWRYGIPGISVAIAYPDGNVWTGHAGVSDVKKKTAVRTDTGFAFGSATKTFTAALVLRLAEEGALSLDDSILRWLPEYAGRTFLGSTPARRQIITVRMLLAQTSGLYDYFNSLSLDARLRAAKTRVWAPDDVLAFVKKPLFIAGDGWSYANTNYLLLGLIAERAGGAPVATQLRTRLFEPLGLASLYLQVAEKPRGPIARGYDFTSLSRTATPIPWSDGTKVMPFTSVTSAAGAAGALAGSARDLARWGLALYGGTVLQPASLAAMLAFDGTAAAGAASDYGLGVGRRLIGDRLTVGHSGRLAGFRSTLRYVPELGVSVAVVTNQDRWDPDRVVEALLDVIDPPPAPTPSPTPSPPAATPGPSQTVESPPASPVP
jgi:D-alanyl-D-alanine carboxypeptidase